MNSERFRELAIEYLTHGLSGAEAAEFQAELSRRGAEGERELDRLQETLAAVALDSDPVEPPPELRQRLSELVRSETDAPTAHPSAWRRIAPALSAIAASIAILLAVWNVRLQSELRDVRSALQIAQSRIAEADSARARLTSLSDDIMTITSPEAAAITLTGTAAQPGARARAFVDPITGRGLLYVYELPILPPDSLYQLWAIRGQTPFDAGTFVVGRTGRARLSLEEATDLVLGADVLAVTIEPIPGLPAPSGPIVMSGTL